MAVIPTDRPIDTLRNEVIDQLIVNYGHGALSVEAFERRLDQAMEASANDQLTALVADLEFEVDEAYSKSKRQQLDQTLDSRDAGDLEHVIDVFGASERRGNWTVPRHMRVISVFSGPTIDMSESRFNCPVTRIRVFSLFAGIDILVPEGVNVQTRIFCVFAGMDNASSSFAEPTAPTIIIEGVALFSGIDIKIKRTLKERFMVFADRMKGFWT